MDAAQLDDLVAVVNPLLRSLETLGFVARNLNPYALAPLLGELGEPEAPLREARPRLDTWPAPLAELRDALAVSSDETLAAYAGLRAAVGGEAGMLGLFRALRHVPRAQEALYPLARAFAPVSRFFLHPSRRSDADLQRSLLEAELSETTGVLHESNDREQRGGYSLYVPEYYSAERAWPLVMALHGGSGHGRAFLWSWLRDARSFGAIVVSPTATGGTWAIQGDDTDSPNLARILGEVRARWRIDETRLLLTGLSDGGTFSYVSGLEGGSPFTHLAPIAAAFHPLLVEFADANRLKGLPIHIVHGALDWMFPADMARQAYRTLSARGGQIVYREIEDLSHTYPREANAGLLEWLNA